MLSAELGHVLKVRNRLLLFFEEPIHFSYLFSCGDSQYGIVQNRKSGKDFMKNPAAGKVQAPFHVVELGHSVAQTFTFHFHFHMVYGSLIS